MNTLTVVFQDNTSKTIDLRSVETHTLRAILLTKYCKNESEVEEMRQLLSLIQRNERNQALADIF